MWVLITKKIETAISPPKLSIFWALPWPGDRGQKRREDMIMIQYCEEHNLVFLAETTGNYRRNASVKAYRGRTKRDVFWEVVSEKIQIGEWVYDESRFYERFTSNPFDSSALFGRGSEPNWAGALKIRYKNEDVRIFPHEYSILSDQRLKLYLEKGVCELVLSDMPGESALESNLEISPDLKVLYEAALLEGASDSQAKLLALGRMNLNDNTEIIPLGWYKCKNEHAALFCDEYEMTG